MSPPLENCTRALDRIAPPAPPTDAQVRKLLQASLAAQGKRSCSKCGKVKLIDGGFPSGKRPSSWCRVCRAAQVAEIKRRAKEAK